LKPELVAGAENATLENVGTGKRGIKLQDWKTRDWKTRERIGYGKSIKPKHS